MNRIIQLSIAIIQTGFIITICKFIRICIIVINDIRGVRFLGINDILYCAGLRLNPQSDVDSFVIHVRELTRQLSQRNGAGY